MVGFRSLCFGSFLPPRQLGQTQFSSLFIKIHQTKRGRVDKFIAFLYSLIALPKEVPILGSFPVQT
jgi:hypothetical protein